jgi:hypothetical protein
MNNLLLFNDTASFPGKYPSVGDKEIFHHRDRQAHREKSKKNLCALSMLRGDYPK